MFVQQSIGRVLVESKGNNREKTNQQNRKTLDPNFDRLNLTEKNILELMWHQFLVESGVRGVGILVKFLSFKSIKRFCIGIDFQNGKTNKFEENLRLGPDQPTNHQIQRDHFFIFRFDDKNRTTNTSEPLSSSSFQSTMPHSALDNQTTWMLNKHSPFSCIKK